MEGKVGRIEPFLMAVLARRFEAITKEMTNTLLRSARSGVLNTARDFSCGITDSRPRLISVAEGLPLHVATSQFIPRAVLQVFGDDIHPGDSFFNNSPYHGNVHHADYTLCVPVFYKGEHLFFTMSRGHQADCGAPQPTTYLPFAKEVYEEGIHFPPTRVQRDYQQIEDFIRICKANIRVPEQWYGDYLAQVGAVRIGERRLMELCDKYGIDTVKAFIDEWQDYSERRMVEEIRRLPKGTWEGETCHDPVPFVAPEGIPVRVKISIDPEEAYITVDLTENVDNVPGGLNLTEASVTAGALTGVFNNLDPTLPHNEGSFSRVRVEVREGSVVGLPKFPVGTSMCTTNVCDRLVNVVQATLAQAGLPHGMAEGGLGMPASASVVSGTDWRRGGAPFVNQLISGFPGGPAVRGHDGWVTYGIPVTGGVLYSDSIEINEQRFPIIYEKNEFATDSGGAGEWDGSLGAVVIHGPRKDPAMWIYPSDGHFNPAQGVFGGMPGGPSDVWKFDVEKREKVDLPKISAELIQPNERIVSEACGGGGYGDPLNRDPERVRWRAREGWISLERARDVYGVVLDTGPEQYAVDYEATNKLREELRKKRGEGK